VPSRTIATEWDWRRGEKIRDIGSHGDELVRHAAYDPDGGRVVTAGDDKVARVWDADTGALLVELAGHEGPVMYAEFSAAGDRIVTASADRTARIWDAATGEQIKRLVGHTNWVNTARFDAEGERIVTGSQDETAKVWSVSGPDDAPPLAVMEGHVDTVKGAAFSTDGKLVATAGEDGAVNMWEAETGVLLWTFDLQFTPARDVAFSPTEGRLVSASDRGALMWSVDYDESTPDQLAVYAACRVGYVLDRGSVARTPIDLTACHDRGDRAGDGE